MTFWDTKESVGGGITYNYQLDGDKIHLIWKYWNGEILYDEILLFQMNENLSPGKKGFQISVQDNSQIDKLYAPKTGFYTFSGIKLKN